MAWWRGPGRCASGSMNITDGQNVPVFLRASVQITGAHLPSFSDHHHHSYCRCLKSRTAPTITVAGSHGVRVASVTVSVYVAELHFGAAARSSYDGRSGLLSTSAADIESAQW